MKRLLLLPLMLWTWIAVADVAVPPLRQRVTDLTGTLSASQQQQIESVLQQFEARKGSQIAVLIVPTTTPETIEQFGLRVAEAWKLGRKGVDDGVVLLVAKDDRAMRIEVGYGLEGALPDAIAKRIISEVITPFFKSGNFFEGIQAGVASMIGVVDGEPLPAPEASPWSAGSDEAYRRLAPMLPYLFFVFFLVVSSLRNFAGRFAGALVGGVIAAVIVWAMMHILVPALLAGLLLFLLLLFVDNRPGRSGGYRSNRSSFGGFSGGFSGGGGSFGGGGASGRW